MKSVFLAAAAATAAAAAASTATAASAVTPPAVILFCIIDDLGWRNVGWHDTAGPENTTPHLTALAREGTILNRHYTHFTCTPSRSSYLTGRLPVHVQVTLANPDVASSGIPRNMTALPLKLKQANPPYSTHIVGKWDMGIATPDHLPTNRGFDSSLFYATHMNFYYSQQITPTGTNCNMSKYSFLHDWWDTDGPAAPNPNKTYIEYLMRDRMDKIVAEHDPAKGPLYLQYASHAMHWPLQVPQEW